MRNRDSTSGKLRILIDTSFLLPALGVEVENEILEAIRFFRRIEVLYLELGLIEAIWKVLKLVPLEKLDRVRIGIEAIKKTYELIEPPPEAYVEAIKIYRQGHRDYVDAMHYATAKACKVQWLTIDYEFISFLEKRGYPVHGIVITPKELKTLLK